MYKTRHKGMKKQTIIRTWSKPGKQIHNHINMSDITFINHQLQKPGNKNETLQAKADQYQPLTRKK